MRPARTRGPSSDPDARGAVAVARSLLAAVALALAAAPQVARAALNINDGTNPAAATLAPGATNQAIDAFELQGQGNPQNYTVSSVTLALTGSADFASVTVTCGASTGTASNPSATQIVALSPSVSVTKTATACSVTATFDGHASLSSATEIPVAATVSTTDQGGTSLDTSSTFTIDNAPPGNATWGTITPGNAQVALAWTNPGDADFTQVVVLRSEASISDAPAEGQTYAQGNTIGGSTVRYVGSAQSFTDTGLTNGSPYHYKIFAKDAYGNYAAGTQTGPHTPAELATTTVGDGTNPGNASLAPGAGATPLDAFTLQTSAGSDTVTAATVTLAAGTGAGLSRVGIWSGAGCTGTEHGFATNPAGDAVAVSLGTSLLATTTPTSYHACVTPHPHAAMPAPPGSTYAVTGTVTAITSANAKTYADAGSATVTVDNLSPADVTALGAAPGDAQVTLSWTNPADADFDRVVILRSAASISDVPAEGADYTAGDPLGSSTVAYVGAASPQTVGSLTNAQLHYFRVFARDASGNYSATGVQTSATPVAPALDVAIGDGSAEPASQGLDPGQTLALDAFTLQTSAGTATITAVVVNLANGTALSGLSIQSSGSCSGGTTYGTLGAVGNGSNTIPTSGLSASTGSGGTDLYVCATGGSVGSPTAVSGTVASVTATGYTSTDGDASSATLTVQAPVVPVTTVGDGADPGSAVVAPGSGARALDAFTLQTSSGTDPVSSVTVTLAAGTWVGLSSLSIQNVGTCDGAVYGTAAPASGTVVVPLTGVTATTAVGAFFVCATPKAHADMPAPPGATYAVTGTVTAIASPNLKTYGDADSATLTVDNQSPPNVSWGALTPASGQVTLDWTNPGGDFGQVVLLRVQGGPVGDAPVEGVAYTPGQTIGGATVRYVGALQTFVDGGLTNGVAYYYKAFARDTNGNHAVGVAAGPAYPGTNPLPAGDPTQDSVRPLVAIVNPGNGAVVTSETEALRVQARVWSPGLPILGVEVTRDLGGSWTPLSQATQYGSDPASGVWAGTLTLAPGSYTLVARARNDAAGWIHSVPVGIVVRPAETGDGQLLLRDNSSQLCTDCHALRSHSSEALGTTYGAWATVCRDCHTPHGTTNLFLVPRQITPPAIGASVPTPRDVTFLSKDALANAQNTGPCQVCHTRTTFYRADGTGATHQTGSDCSTCHLHTDGLKASCTTCHGTEGRVSFPPETPPVDTCGNSATAGGTGVNRVGAHEAHLLGSGPTDGIDCAECHQVPPSRAGHPGASCSPDPAQRALFTWGTLATGEVDPWNTSAPAAPSFDYATQTCSSTYCHGSFKNSGVTSSVGWHATVACGDCHGLPPPQPTHSSTSTDCEQCHGTGYALAGIGGAALATHVDGRLDVANLTCTSCHGTDGRTLSTTLGTGDPLLAAAPPVDHNGATSSNLVGPHQAHVNPAQAGQVFLPVACSECHGTAVNAYATTHSDSVKNVTFVDALTANLGGVTGVWSDGDPSSCTTYCHGDGFPAAVGGTVGSWSWDTATSAACDACHAGPPADPVHTSVPKPSAAAVCNACHGTTVSATGAIVFTGTGGSATTLHLDGAASTSGVTCHSCHGSETNDAPPALANSANANGVGAHPSHVNTGQMTTRTVAYACTQCHPDNTTMNHANGGAPEMLWTASLSTAAVWTDGTSSCATAYCHGGTTGQASWGGLLRTPVWTDAGDAYRGCTACHAAPPPLDATTHHPQNPSCASCHPAGSSQTAMTGAAASTHVDGSVDRTRTGCTECHGDLSQTAVANTSLAPAPGWFDGSTVVGVDVDGATTGARVGAHRAHLQGTNLRSPSVGCTECHALPAGGDVTHATGTGSTGARALLTWGTLANGTVGGGASTSPSFASGTCSSTYCHGATLSGGTTQNPTWTTGAAARACAACHGNPPPAPHVQNTSCGTATCHGTGYSNTAVTGAALGTHVNGTVNQNASTCTSCHGTSGRASNGVADPTYQPAAPPQDTTGATAVSDPQVGAHLVHVNGTRSRQVACTECHLAETPATNDYLHANGSTTIDTAHFGTLARTGGVSPTYSGGATPTCSATYCHGNFTGGNGAGATPVWTTAATLTCAQCHPAPPSSARHGRHVSGGASYSFTCDECHASTVANDSTTAIGTSASHVNGSVDWQFSTTATAASIDQSGGSYSAGTCSATYCHSGGVATASPFSATASAALAWTTGTASCRSCHGWDAAARPTIGVSTGSSFQGSAKHANHVDNSAVIGTNYVCGDCHQTTVAAGTSSPITSAANHVNGTKNVSFPARNGQTSAAYASPSCNSNYCHSNGRDPAATDAARYANVTWSQAGTLSCTGCHGRGGATFGAPDYADGSTLAEANSHAAHVSSAADCDKCHTQTSTTGTAIDAGSTLHTNGARDVTIAAAYDTNAGSSNYDSSTKTCSGVSCHGGGTPQWGTTLGCNSCHGTSTPRTPVAGADANLDAAPPVDTTGASTGVKVGAHVPHVNQLTLRASALACANCHPSPNTHQGTRDAAWSALASNGGAVTPTPSATTGYTSTWEATPTCTNYCHGTDASLAAAGGSNKTPSWTGGSAQAACGTCHAAPPPLSSTAGQDHPRNAVCADCHGAGYATAGLGGSAKGTHIDRAIQKPADGCTACHGVLAGVGGAPAANTSRTAAPGYVGATTGESIRGETAATAPAVGAHDKHLRGTALRVNGSGFAADCADCHAVPPTSDTAHATGSGTGGAHATLTWSAFARTGGLTPSYAGSDSATTNTTAGSCASTYCHGKWTGNATYAGTNVAPGWTGGSAAAACGTCHKVPPSSGAHGSVGPTTSCSGCHPGYACTSGNLAACTVDTAKHVNGQLDGGGGPDCTTSGCHDAAAGSRRNVLNDFANGTSPNYRSHHVGNGGSPFGGTLTDNDCRVCHAEYDAAQATTGTLHMNGLIDLRDADDNSSYFQYDADAVAALGAGGANSGSAIFRQEMSGRTDDAVGAPNYFTATCPSGSATCKKGLDRFCIRCHDADGASASRTLGEAGATALNPFNDGTITNMSDQVSRGRVTDVASRVHETARRSDGTSIAAADRDAGYAPTGATVRGADGRNDPPEGVFARHAIRGLSVSVYGSTDAGWDTTTYWNRASYAWSSTSVMACADCHTTDGANGVDGNAHGSSTEYLLKNADGTSAGEPAPGSYASYSCAACHNAGYYQAPNTGTHTNNASDWQDSTNQVGVAARVTTFGKGGNILGIACGNCHGGGPPNKTGATFPTGSTGATGFGTIHGTSQVLGIGSATGTSRPAYRFTNGNSMRYYDPGAWSTSATTRTCYTLARNNDDSWGACIQHSGGATSDLEAPQKRPIGY